MASSRTEVHTIFSSCTVSKEVIHSMLEEMFAPCRTATDEEFESCDDNNDCGHIIPSSWKSVDMAMNYKDIENVFFSFPFGTCFFFNLIWVHILFPCLARPCLDLPPFPTFFHHGQNKLQACQRVQDHQSMIISTTSSKHGSKRLWMFGWISWWKQLLVDLAPPIEGCSFNFVSRWHGQLYVGIQRDFRILERLHIEHYEMCMYGLFNWIWLRSVRLSFLVVQFVFAMGIQSWYEVFVYFIVLGSQKFVSAIVPTSHHKKIRQNYLKPCHPLYPCVWDLWNLCPCSLTCSCSCQCAHNLSTPITIMTCANCHLGVAIHDHAHVRVHGHRFYRSLTHNIGGAIVVGNISRCPTRGPCKSNQEYDYN